MFSNAMREKLMAYATGSDFIIDLENLPHEFYFTA
jgi:hypothetical protein